MKKIRFFVIDILIELIDYWFLNVKSKKNACIMHGGVTVEVRSKTFRFQPSFDKHLKNEIYCQCKVDF